MNKVHDQDFEAIRLFFNEPGKTFVDIGANRGEAVNSIFTCCPSAKIVAFEPNKFIYDKLLVGVRKDKRRHFMAYNYGLSSKSGDFTLYVPYYKKFMYDGLASLHFENASDWLENRMWYYNPKHLSVKECKVQLKCLDDFKLNPYFVKIDVQGHEIEVLKGARKTLETNKPVLLVESPDDAVVQFMTELGYDYFMYSQGKFFKHEMGSVNTFFIHEVTADKLPMAS
ncbi:FkbM family methyltransferase [Fulvivirga sediminis]|uniref:FkbM family methyltransferase n=1 Tax=Fulvivirga sediminis TaxID=2803949 RepID=A0A937K1L6_9BACT|nr:FkbM family methyltransferase [Fulvivirga sediminis]MBL3657626.1 FkbM family methyltransferase [Fulvivirga sediminis]